MSFSDIISDLNANFYRNKNFIKSLLKKNPNMAYTKINEITSFVGNRYKLDIQLHFPDPQKIKKIDDYGSENVGIVFDKFRKTFPISRDVIKKKTIEFLPSSTISDAYMYEGKEGLRIVLPEGRIELLPGSIHIWCFIDENIVNYIDWLFFNVLNKQ
ncbi:MAG: hypothetical protein ACPKQO_03130 [Nitrososphaeraceae archaeon]